MISGAALQLTVPDSLQDDVAAQFYVNPTTVVGLVDAAGVPKVLIGALLLIVNCLGCFGCLGWHALLRHEAPHTATAQPPRCHSLAAFHPWNSAAAGWVPSAGSSRQRAWPPGRS